MLAGYNSQEVSFIRAIFPLSSLLILRPFIWRNTISLIRIRLWSVLGILFLVTTSGHIGVAQTQNELSPYYLGDSAFTLDKALENDQNVLTITDSQTVDLTKTAIIYPDVRGQLTPSAIASRYLRGDRPLLNQKDMLSYRARGTDLWIMVPLYNRTGQSQWLLDFGNRLSGRTAQFSGLIVMDLLNNSVSFNQQASKTATGFTNGATASRYDPKIAINLKAQSAHLLLIHLKPNATTPMISQLRLSSPAGIYGSAIWLQEWPYLSVIFFFTGIIVAISLLSARPMLMGLALYIIALSSTVLLPVPLIEESSNLPRLIVSLHAVAGLCLSIGVYAIARLTALQLAWKTLQMLLIGVHVLLIVTTIFAPPILVFNPFFQIALIIPATALILLVSFLQLRDGSDTGIYMGLTGLLNFIVFVVQDLSVGQVIAAHTITLNISLFSIFLIGPFLLILLQRTNVFVEAIEISKRRKRSLGDEEQMAKLRQAKETFDYNNLLKVIDHERRQLADARARESLRSEEMRKARDMADEANRAKSAFLAVISHEIRTPMTGIMGMVKLLLDTTLNKNQHEFVVTIKESGNAMMGLLNDILDFEKIESGKMQLEMLDFDLHRLINGVTTLMNGHATTKGLDLKTEIDTSVPQYIVGDSTRLRQILLNLVGNAVKFTQKGSVTIKISATHNEQEGIKNRSHQIYIAVIDTGIGISAESQKNIFNPFAQADKTIARKFGGSGLGLAISKRLVEAMGSQINIKSREGQGTTFFFSLSAKEGDPAIADENLNKTGKKSSPSVTKTPLSRLRILIVEDNSITQKVLRTIIEQGQHDVLICSSAEEALPYLNMGERFDLIFSDIQMQGMSGYEFVQTIRKLQDPISRNTPVYALTGNVDQSDIQACMDAGMNGHLAKPIDPDAFDEVLAQVSEKRGARIVAKPAPVPASKSAPITSLVNDPELELLSTLRESLGDEQVQELLKGLYDKTEEIIDALTKQSDMNMGVIRERAHELKGMCGNFGMITLSNLAKEIETRAKDGITEDLNDLIKKLPPTYETGRQKIDNWMAS